jgi:hypothetical protein
MMTRTEVARLTRTQPHVVRRWQHDGVLAGHRGYERIVQLAYCPTTEQLMDFLASADGHPSLRNVPDWQMRAARHRQARLAAAAIEALPPAVRVHR